MLPRRISEHTCTRAASVWLASGHHHIVRMQGIAALQGQQQRSFVRARASVCLCVCVPMCMTCLCRHAIMFVTTELSLSLSLCLCVCLYVCVCVLSSQACYYVCHNRARAHDGERGVQPGMWHTHTRTHTHTHTHTHIHIEQCETKTCACVCRTVVTLAGTTYLCTQPCMCVGDCVCCVCSKWPMPRHRTPCSPPTTRTHSL